ncbi:MULTISPECIES: YhjD/YihY/BrkB family envelope integrity protein [Streptomyces]|uniref:YhjD/YihY/BrkB family envelope integrity protein n=1 Tax=Streptomyces TaxID=1883 RepID=UPI002930FC70|nr:YhjD/YihY/BrkB family envelope integrity protein [Streptomyces sp. NEAU-HV9]
MRVINRFQKIVGFDRSMALASSALTALIPLAIVLGVVFDNIAHGNDVANRIITRYHLTGGGAEAVTSLFTPAGETSSSVGVFGVVFLTISALSFARTSQRLFEQTWELKPLSVRNTRKGLWWILALGGYLAVSGWLYAVLPPGRLGLAAALCDVPVTAGFLLWSGRLLSANRIGWVDLFPFAVTASLLTGVYQVGATVYMPRLFNSYASRYGSVGAVFAMISGLFGAMLVIVGSSAIGREVRDELGRIRRGQRPSEREVRRQWDSVVALARSRWQSAREQIPHRRAKE